MDPQLLVRITGDATGINRVMADVGDRATRLTSNLGGLASAVLLPLGALTVGGAAALSWIGRVAEGIDQLNDLSDATGSTVESLSALEDAGARTGTSLDTIGAIVVKFNNGLKEADGKNGVSRALKEIGVDVEDLKKMDPAEALRVVAVQLSGYTNEGNKARIIQELFGKSVRESAPFLADLAKQTELVATVTAKEAEAAEKFGHQLSSLQKDALDLSRVLAGPLIQSINKLFAGVKAYGSLSSYIFDNFRFDAASDIAGNLGKTNKEIDGVQKRLSRIGEIQGREGLSDALVNRYKAERLELEKQLETLKGRQKYLLGQAPDPTGSPTELARRGRGPQTLGDIGGGTPDKPKKAPALDPIEEADRRMQEALERYIERDTAAEERITADSAREQSRRLDNALRFGAQLSDQTQVLTASLITDERARGEALIEIDRQVMADQIAAMGVAANVELALYDELNANIVARQAALTEQLKPEWQRLVEGWADTTRAMQRFSDDFMLGFLRTGEDTFVRWVESGEVSTKGLTSFIRQEFARLAYQQFLAQATRNVGQSLLQGILGVVGSLTGGRQGSDPNGFNGTQNNPSAYVATPMATGSNYVPYDGFLAKLHKGEAVVPAKYNPAAGGAGGGTVYQVGQGAVYNIGQGVSRGEVFQAVRAANNELMEKLRRSKSRGGEFA